MNLEDENTPSFEEQMASCPIHRWADINWYLQEAQVPEYLWTPFHELVIERGKYPKVMENDQGKLFGTKAVDITLRYEISAQDGQSLLIMFGQLIEQWLATGADLN